MAKVIIIYTDGSFIDTENVNRGGIAFIVINKTTMEEHLAFANVCASSSTETELLAVIHAMRYLFEHGISSDVIEVRCNDIGIVKFFAKKLYLKYDQMQWQKPNGLPVRKFTDYWRTLLNMVLRADAKTMFKKAVKTDQYNREAHMYAYNAAKNGIEWTLETRKITEIKADTTRTFGNKNTKMINSFTYGERFEKKLCRKASWYDNIVGTDNIIEINVSDIVLIEKVHLNCNEIHLNGQLKRYSYKKSVKKPIAVRKINDQPQYALVIGLSRFAIARMLGIKTLTAYVTDMSYAEFAKEFEISTESSKYEKINSNEIQGNR